MKQGQGFRMAGVLARTVWARPPLALAVVWATTGLLVVTGTTEAEVLTDEERFAAKQLMLTAGPDFQHEGYDVRISPPQPGTTPGPLEGTPAAPGPGADAAGSPRGRQPSSGIAPVVPAPRAGNAARNSIPGGVHRGVRAREDNLAPEIRRIREQGAGAAADIPPPLPPPAVDRGGPFDVAAPEGGNPGSDHPEFKGPGSNGERHLGGTVQDRARKYLPAEPALSYGTRPTGKETAARGTAVPGLALQVAAFRAERSADSLVAELSARFQGAYISETISGGEPLYRVRLGGFDTPAERDAMRKRLTEAGHACFNATE